MQKQIFCLLGTFILISCSNEHQGKKSFKGQYRITVDNANLNENPSEDEKIEPDEVGPEVGTAKPKNVDIPETNLGDLEFDEDAGDQIRKSETDISNAEDGEAGSLNNAEDGEAGSMNNGVDGGENKTPPAMGVVKPMTPVVQMSTSVNGQTSTQKTCTESIEPVIFNRHHKQVANQESVSIGCDGRTSVLGLNINFQNFPNAGIGNLDLQCGEPTVDTTLLDRGHTYDKQCNDQEHCSHYCGDKEHISFVHVNFRKDNAGKGNLQVKCSKLTNDTVFFTESINNQSLNQESAGKYCADDEILTGISVNFRGQNAGTGNVELRCTKVRKKVKQCS